MDDGGVSLGYSTTIGIDVCYYPLAVALLLQFTSDHDFRSLIEKNRRDRLVDILSERKYFK